MIGVRSDMALFKSEEEKAAARERKEQKKFSKSPVGHATAALERGDALFQVVLRVDEDNALIVSQIEALVTGPQ